MLLQSVITTLLLCIVCIKAASAPQTLQPPLPTHPAISMMMLQDGVPEELVSQFVIFNDSCTASAIELLTSARQGPIEDAQKERASVLYTANIRQWLGKWLGSSSKFKDKYAKWSDFSTNDFIFKLSMHPTSRVSQVDYITIPTNILNDCQVGTMIGEGILVMEYEVNVIMTAIKTFSTTAVSRLSVLCVQYANLLQFAAETTLHHLNSHSIQAFVPIKNSLRWVHSCFKDAIIEYAASMTCPAYEETVIEYFPGWKMRRETEISDPKARKPLPIEPSQKDASVELFAVIELGHQILSIEAFQNFMRKELRQLLSFQVNDISEYREELKKRERTRPHSETAIKFPQDQSALTALGNYLELWRYLRAFGLVYGVTSYWSAYLTFTVSAENYKGQSPTTLPLLIEWAVIYEALVEDLQRDLLHAKISFPEWATHYKAFKSLKYPLSTVLRSAQDYVPMPSKVAMSHHSRDSLRRSKETAFGISRVTLEFMHRVIVKEPAGPRRDSEEIQYEMLVMKLEGALLGIQSICYSDLVKDEQEGLSRIFDFVVQSIEGALRIQNAETELLKKALLLESTFFKLASNLGVIMHFPILDTLTKATLLDHFVRRLVFTKSFFLFHITGKSNVNLLAKTVYDLIRREMQMICRLGLLEPRIFFGTPFVFIY